MYEHTPELVWVCVWPQMGPVHTALALTLTLVLTLTLTLALLGVLLQTEEGELSLLVSAAAKPVRPHAESSHHGCDRLGLGLGSGYG